jgi:hypothetical protein
MVLEKEYLSDPKELLSSGFNFNLGMIRTESVYRQLVSKVNSEKTRFTRTNA